MRRTRQCRGISRGFTLIELLVVIGIIAILAGILLPALIAVSNAMKKASTESLIRRIELAVAAFEKDTTMLPPDYIPASFLSGVSSLQYPGFRLPTTSAILPPEMLAGALGNPRLADNADVRDYIPNIEGHVPYTSFSRGSELEDYNDNGFPEVVDAWGRPLLYNRPPFPSGHELQVADYPSSGNGGKPWHRPDSYDLYSVGRDGQTGPAYGQSGYELVPDPAESLAQYCQKAMNQSTDGDAADDIPVWKR